MVALFVMFSIICFLTIDYLVQLPQLGESRVGSEASTTSEATVSGRFSTSVENFSYGKPVPLGIYLNPGHTWAKPESSGSLRIGIDSLPAHAVGVPDEICLLPGGCKVKRGDPLLKIWRDGKKLTVCAPMDGVIESANCQALNDPSNISKDPYGRGWLYRFMPDDSERTLAGMFKGGTASEWLGMEMSRLKDFLFEHHPSSTAVGATMPDGGLLAEGCALQLPDDGWSCLVNKFFDSKSGCECEICASKKNS